jgi:hypothetical protein
MDWPKRSLWSRVTWLRLRLHYWRAARRRGTGTSLDGGPAWWSEFEHAFWSHVRSQAMPPDTRPAAKPPRRWERGTA